MLTYKPVLIYSLLIKYVLVFPIARLQIQLDVWPRTYTQLLGLKRP
jgi:hypothetical protein